MFTARRRQHVKCWPTVNTSSAGNETHTLSPTTPDCQNAPVFGILPDVPRLIPCPHCENHVKLVDSACPHCGEAIRDASGNLLRAASAVLLGLAATAGACGGDEPVAEYGPAPTGGTGTGTQVGGSGGEGGSGGGSADGGGGTGGMGMGGEPVAEYGPVPSVGGGGSGSG